VIQANAELFGRRGEVVRFLSENGEATQKQIADRHGGKESACPASGSGQAWLQQAWC